MKDGAAVCCVVTWSILAVVFVQLHQDRRGHHQEVSQWHGDRVGHHRETLTQTTQTLNTETQCVHINNYNLINLFKPIKNRQLTPSHCQVMSMPFCFFFWCVTRSCSISSECPALNNRTIYSKSTPNSGQFVPVWRYEFLFTNTPSSQYRVSAGFNKLNFLRPLWI